MSLSEKWINTILKIATGRSLLKKIITPFGIIIFLSFYTALIFLSLYLDKIFQFPDFLFPPLDIILGLIFIVPGIVLSCYCIYYFIKSKGTPVPLNPPPKLINKGPYALSRNPMLTGLFFQLFGFGFICNSITLTFIVTPIFILLNVIELKKIEEPELEKRLGSEYSEYKKSVPMFIPNVKKH